MRSRRLQKYRLGFSIHVGRSVSRMFGGMRHLRTKHRRSDRAYSADGKNLTFSAFLLGQQAAARVLQANADEEHCSSIMFANADAAMKGYLLSRAFVAASHRKSWLA